jgi:type VI protein secretion system component VasF
LLEELIKSVSALKTDITSSEAKTKKELLEHIEGLKSSQETLSEAHETYKRYLHYAIGALTIFYFLGFDQKIKAILLQAGG